MSTHDLPIEQRKGPIYQIRVHGQLGEEWTAWFDGLTVTQEANGDTLLTGPVVDQAALYGLLRKVRNLGLPLLAVAQIEMPLDDARNGQ